MPVTMGLLERVHGVELAVPDSLKGNVVVCRNDVAKGVGDAHAQGG